MAVEVPTPRFRIQQNGGNHGLHVAALPGTNGHASAAERAADKNIGHTLDVGAAGIAGDQMLNQLLANKWRQAGLRENIVERACQIGLRGLPGRQNGSRAIDREKRFGGGIVIALERDHRADPVGGVVLLRACAGLPWDTSSR